MRKLGPYEEILDYLDLTSLMISKMDNPSTKEDGVKLNIGVLMDLRKEIKRLISKLETV